MHMAQVRLRLALCHSYRSVFLPQRFQRAATIPTTIATKASTIATKADGAENCEQLARTKN
jgi:hypothetical protein